MADSTDIIKVQSSKGFVYEVTIEHHPGIGLSMAYYKGATRIARREYSKLTPPIGDNDSDWERYEESLAEWKSAAIADLTPECKIHFDKREGYNKRR